MDKLTSNNLLSHETSTIKKNFKNGVHKKIFTPFRVTITSSFRPIRHLILRPRSTTFRIGYFYAHRAHRENPVLNLHGCDMFHYTVKCTFLGPSRDSISKSWLEWLEHEHIQDVIEGGAIQGEIVQMDTDDGQLTFEIRYLFQDRAAFKRYESDHAPRLREEGLSRFPLEKGLHYERTTGEQKAIVKL